MDRRTVVILYSMTFTKISKEVTIKLLAIISDQNLWEAKTTDDISPYKALNFHSGDGGQCFCLSPFGEVVNGYNCELGLSFIQGERTNNVHPPLRKRPWAADSSHELCWELLDIGKPLALVTLLY
ncbi:hypothetical protein LguiB_002497 [Lonicera macranthoides]